MLIHRRQLLNATSAFTLAALTQPQAASAAEPLFCAPDDPLQALLDLSQIHISEPTTR